MIWSHPITQIVICLSFVGIAWRYGNRPALNPVLALMINVIIVIIGCRNLLFHLHADGVWIALTSVFAVAYGVAFGVANAARVVRQVWR